MYNKKELPLWVKYEALKIKLANKYHEKKGGKL
jgi:hypothetical protein